MSINCILSGQVSDTQFTKVVKHIEEQIATEGQTQFTINLETFDYVTDDLTVNSGITTLSPISDYSVDGRVITLNEGVPAGRNITIKVLQNVLSDGAQMISGAQVVDGTISLEKLSVDVATKEDLNSIDLSGYAQCSVPMMLSVNENGGLTITYDDGSGN